jgi:hypothetical protein
MLGAWCGEAAALTSRRFACTGLGEARKLVAMKPHLPLGRSVVVLLLLSLIIPLSGNAARTPLLRYRADASTNVFRVLIEMRSDTGKESLTGNLIVSTREFATNVIKLSLRGNLMPKREMTGLPYGGRPPRWMTPINLGEGCELLLDSQGRVLRISGDYPLPFPLGSIFPFFVPPLPAKAESKWTTTQSVIVLDEPYGLGPSPGFGWLQGGAMMGYSYSAYSPGLGRNLSAVVFVSQTIRTEIVATAGNVATVKQQLVVDSPLLTGSEPRLSANGTGTWVFDVQGGFMRGADLEFQGLFNSETTTRRMTAQVRIELLEGKERDAALAPPQSRSELDPATGQPIAKTLTGAELERVSEELKSSDENKQRAAANRLTSAELVEPPAALVAYLTNFLFNAESPLRQAAIKVVADFGTAANVPELIRLLRSSDSSATYAALRGLSRLQDERAIEPLVELVAAGSSEAHMAVTALEKFPTAETAILTLLKERNVGTKRHACTILRKIGTQNSVAPLQELVGHADSSLSSAAVEALRAVQSRL